MSLPEACTWWRPDDCAGTPDCPPRCPRYVAPDGTVYTVLEHDAATELMSPRSLLNSIETANDGVGPPAAGWADLLDDAEVALFAFDPDGPVGVAAYDREAGVGLVAATGRADQDAGGDDSHATTELGRHLVAHAIEGDADQLTIYAPDAARDRLATELGEAATPVDGEPAIRVALRTNAAHRTTRVPARKADVAAPPDLAALVAPDAVAVVGATEREDSLGRVVCENLVAGFDGEVCPVTDRHESVLGVPAADSVSAVDGSVDLAVIVLPPAMVLEAVQDAAAAGVDAVAVLSAGFGEAGGEGTERERALRELAAAEGFALVGPNALGVISTRAGLNASFAPTVPEAGGVSVLSHSGAMITAILDWADDAGVGVRDVVSLGNGAGVDEAALLRFWGADPDTDLVVAYLEDVAAGREFVAAAREVAPSTPVLVLKGGRSAAGAAAAASHTGALVDADAGFDAAFDAAGVVRVPSQAALHDAVRAFATQPPLRGDRVAVVTNAGGPGVLAADAVSGAGLAVADLAAETRESLADVLPDAATPGNPVDVLGDAPVERIAAALEVVLADPVVDAAMVVTTPHPLVSRPDLVRAVGDAARRYGTPTVAVVGGGPPDDRTRAAAAEAGLPVYDDADRAAGALAAMATHAARRERPVDEPVPVSADRDAVATRLRSALTPGRETLGVEALDLLEAYGVPTPAWTMAETPMDAGEAAASIGGRVALKVASPDLAHKTDVGGVRVGVEPADVADVAGELLEAVGSAAPDADLEGVLVQAMAPAGLELLVGVTRHGRFGPLLTVGLGGVDVEALDVTAHALAPATPAEAERVVESVAGDRLDGHRGRPPVDRDALVDAVVRLSWLAADWPSVAELEVNPLVATPDGALALDFYATLDPAAG